MFTLAVKEQSVVRVPVGRGDSAYSREDIMSWCEEQVKVDYVLAMATNGQLKLRAFDIIEKAKEDLDLFAERTSITIFDSNQLRLWLSLMAYVLMQAFRQNCLKRTSLTNATVGTIRLSL